MTEYEGSYNEGGDFDEDDIFAAPPKAINFTEEWTKGERYRLPVVGKPNLIQGLDTNRKPAFWEDGVSPKMVGVTPVRFQAVRRSLWAPKPSALWAGIIQASQAAGHSVRIGGMLEVEYGGTGPKQRGKSAPHLFPDVVYYPPGEWENQPGADEL